MKLRNRIAFGTSVIVALTLSIASALIYWSVWHEDQFGNIERTTSTLLTSLLILVVLGSVMSLFLGSYLSRKTLEPVQRLIREVEIATESTRIIGSYKNDEIGKIGDSLNGLLDRIEASSRNQKRFTADAGHELRGPLTTIQLSVDTLRADKDSVELQDISKEIGRLAKLCNDLLDLSRVDGQVIEMKDHPFMEILQEQLRTFRGSKTEIEVVIDVTPDLIIHCNPQLFGLALRNLLENAFQYARSQITISTDEADDGLHVIISDDGPGVPEAEKYRIFERFYRTESVRTIGKGGTGLGLSVVSAVMQAHGGKSLSLGINKGEFHLVLIKPGVLFN